ncbi:hypothetical protein HID58_036560 [Brassica napus]|uniref:Secreted protein n=1 Tax=Brassica napus TaxID=3708 RepID=A0ABQ8C840_BRANA|nr:hypothetical protein HID58_036560 [Brassica napus]
MVGEVLCFFLVSLVRFEKRVVMLQRRHHDVYTVERATKEKAKSDFFGGELTAVRSKRSQNRRKKQLMRGMRILCHWPTC